jgi:hypothetical protein
MNIDYLTDNFINDHFVTKTSSLIDLHIMYKNKEIANTSTTKFLRLTLNNTFSWKNHIDAIVPKLSPACFTVRAVKPFLSQGWYTAPTFTP